MSGELEPAHAALERSLQILPEQNYAAANLDFTLLLQRRPADALIVAEKSTSDLFRMQCTAMAWHDLGHKKEARTLLDEITHRFSHGAAFQIAELHAWFGESDQSIQWLERAYAQHDSGLPWAKVDPVFRTVRGDPRFKEVLRKMKLPEN